ncbi:putative glycerophosphodiester phosphodiesterase, protein kinase RLK-Pelle-LRK10L-2 family [Medicago truncatula]|uniref:non-specific serine/threonine protein kinase n=2 Tax=Medicago truncatula TaxID=3880 RepID=A0A396K395_MEDTR|nr:rust resistance kinase Lr10 [Medicago truncatula]RHN82398.1 putative glycerophosphodiester phosphodiesterase, protein kinase RLK-Pelle-LRK10L-2 family [Medicago truncatula]
MTLLMAWLFIFKSLLFSLIMLHVSAQDGGCPTSFSCGYLGQITFPFTVTQYPHCGILAISGCDQKNTSAPNSIQLGKMPSKQSLIVTYVEGNTITVSDETQQKYLLSKKCQAFHNYPVPPTTPLGSFYIKFNITMFKCNRSLKVTPPKSFQNYANCSGYDIYYDLQNIVRPPPFKVPNSLAQCTQCQAAVRDMPNDDPFEFLSPQISIVVQLSDDCNQCLHHQGGRCRLDIQGKFHCAEGNRGWFVKMLILGVGVLVVTAAILLIVVKIYYTRWRTRNPTNLVIEVFLKKHGHLQTKRYCYSEIKKVTDSFKHKLGQGGFGSVYKGRLHDGRYVAVKILNELKDSGEEFMNEVASICGTSHVNIVTLLGFCLEGSKRALVYEFMQNGSLEKYIFEENDQILDLQLDCQTLYYIAIGVARGLEYLHKGCNTRILHFDIKPHNILLDENFNPRISDFGLAKICTRKESMVSIFGARGTAGYIAPEVFSRNFGAVSHKSDVYSYGMMVMEMVGRRKNINTEVDRSSEIYFPHWIYNRLDSNQDLGLRNVRNEIDDEKVRKMTIVALWCIQTNPSTRPDISKVVEMLEGRVELLQMPPKPFLSSPAISPPHFSSETLESQKMLDAEQREHY